MSVRTLAVAEMFGQRAQVLDLLARAADVLADLINHDRQRLPRSSNAHQLEGAADDEEDVKDEVNSFELGVVVGAGYYGSFFLLEGRYQEGLTDIADFGDELGTTDDSYRNRSVVVMVGVRFGR